MDDFTNTVDKYGALLETLNSKIEGMNNSLSSMECHLGNLNQMVVMLGTKFNTLDHLLGEVFRREQEAMQQLGDLASRYSGEDL